MQKHIFGQWKKKKKKKRQLVTCKTRIQPITNLWSFKQDSDNMKMVFTFCFTCWIINHTMSDAIIKVTHDIISYHKQWTKNILRDAACSRSLDGIISNSWLYNLAEIGGHNFMRRDQDWLTKL